jgi:hypothetical protein
MRPTNDQVERVRTIINTPLVQGSALAGLNAVDMYLISNERDHILDLLQDRYPHATRDLVSVDQLTQSILAKAFRGELVPQNPNDEPASVLLERIRQEREAAAALIKAAKRGTRKPRKAKAAQA